MGLAKIGGRDTYFRYVGNWASRVICLYDPSFSRKLSSVTGLDEVRRSRTYPPRSDEAREVSCGTDVLDLHHGENIVECGILYLSSNREMSLSSSPLLIKLSADICRMPETEQPSE